MVKALWWKKGKGGLGTPYWTVLPRLRINVPNTCSLGISVWVELPTCRLAVYVRRCFDAPASTRSLTRTNTRVVSHRAVARPPHTPSIADLPNLDSATATSQTSFSKKDDYDRERQAPPTGGRLHQDVL